MSATISPSRESLRADRKALLVNLDRNIYGTFAEIGAGQEVARHFFRVGGAAGTIAKTMSAYDMTFSDEIYGKSSRYVSRERLLSMLKHEYDLLIERLSAKQGAEKRFFVFADTVSARNFKGTNECHGWMGVRFQPDPLSEPSDIIIHVRMTDRENLLQQQALGIIGVSLLYGAYFYRNDPDRFVASLLDELSIERLEVDMIEFIGPAFEKVDNRLISLKLVHRGLTNAVMIAPDGGVLQPSEVLRKRPVLVLRGRFRPITNVNLDMLNCALQQFKALPSVKDKEPLALFELTLNNFLAEGGSLDDQDFLDRADTLSSLGFPVLISNYSEHYRLSGYFRRYTSEAIGMAMGIETLLGIFDPRYYEGLEGGTLEALGRLFKKEVKLYVHPVRREDYAAMVERARSTLLAESSSPLPEILSVEDLKLIPRVAHFYAYLRELGHIEPIRGFNQKFLSILSPQVLSEIKKLGSNWEDSVPAAAVKVIKERGVFGYPK